MFFRAGAVNNLILSIEENAIVMPDDSITCNADGKPVPTVTISVLEPLTEQWMHRDVYGSQEAELKIPLDAPPGKYRITCMAENMVAGKSTTKTKCIDFYIIRKF